MRNQWWRHNPRRVSRLLLLLSLLLVACSACESSNPVTLANGAPSPTNRQLLRLPNVGIQDIDYLDPALEPNPNDPNQGPDPNSALVISMLYSGLVRVDKNLNVIPDQATWDISPNGKVYTFQLRPDLTFSDGTPINASTYVYSITRALLPALKAPEASLLARSIVGADAVLNGKKTVLAGVKALNDQTLQISLNQATPYFLEILSNQLFLPVNKHLIDAYGQTAWTQNLVGNGAGSGPFMIKSWEHSIRMVLVPNPLYYGPKPRLTEVDMSFVNDPNIAYQQYRSGQFDLIWNMDQSDLASAKGMNGFNTSPMLQTDMLFFNTKVAPFDNPTVRQAFAYAIDKASLAHVILKDAVTPASTIIPPGTPGYQPTFQGIPYDANKARGLLLSVYPDVSLLPQVTLSYPTDLVSRNEAAWLRAIWSTGLGISVNLLPIESNAYNDEVANHQVQLGFKQWNADFADPYDWLVPNLLSSSDDNYGQWQNSNFDQLISQAEQTTSGARIAYYNQAEQLSITEVGALPLDHQTTNAVIPAWVHGVSLNALGLYFGDWSTVYLSPH